MLKRLVCVVGLVGALSTPAYAAEQFYECDLNAKRSLGWVSEKMGFIFDGKGGVKVVDGIILHFLEKHIAAKARKNGDNLRITWNIPAATDRVGQKIPSMGYIATLNTKSMAVSVVAKPISFPQRFSGKGTCKIRKNLRWVPRS